VAVMIFICFLVIIPVFTKLIFEINVAPESTCANALCNTNDKTTNVIKLYLYKLKHHPRN